MSELRDALAPLDFTPNALALSTLKPGDDVWSVEYHFGKLVERCADPYHLECEFRHPETGVLHRNAYTEAGLGLPHYVGRTLFRADEPGVPPRPSARAPRPMFPAAVRYSHSQHWLTPDVLFASREQAVAYLSSLGATEIVWPYEPGMELADYVDQD